MRLIDADALHNVLRKKPRWIVRNGDKHNEGYTYDQVHFAIDDMPTIEPKQGVLVAKKDVMETLKTTLADDMLLDTLELRVNDLPTVEDLPPTTHLIKYWAERKHGHGVEHIPHCKCANCDTDYLPRMAMNMNYCPMCGARFIKERDDRDS